MAELIGVDKLREFFETIILTGRVKDLEPVSAMIIADPERGKTSVVVEKNCEAFRVLTDLTGKGIQWLCQMDHKCTHLVVNDMVTIMAHGRTTRDYFLSMLIAMTEEGVRAVAGPQGLETVNKGRRGFVGCITSSQAKDNRSWWYKRGLSRRMVPFHFDYSADLILNIKARIDNGHGANFVSNEVFTIPEKNIPVQIPEQMATKIRTISDFRAKKLGQLGISLLKNYRGMAQGHALLRSFKNPIVNEQDVEFLIRIDPYVDWTTPGLL